MRTEMKYWVLGALLGGLALPLALGLTGHPDLSVHGRPLRTHAGALSREAPPGQAFHCGHDGLKSIDVALASLGATDEEVELVLRDEGIEGPVIRSIQLSPGALSSPELISFEFEPIADSADRWFHFQLLPGADRESCAYSPWIRYHGQTGRDDPWGEQSLEHRSTRNYFQSPLGDLRAIAVGCEHLSTSEAEVRFALWDLDDAGSTRREFALAEPLVVNRGYAFFGFEPIPASKGRSYGYMIESEAPMRFNGRFERPTLKTLHGLVGETPRLGGASSGDHLFEDRDLVFRTRTDYGPGHGAGVAVERAGWRFPVAILSWALAVLALAKFLASSVRESDPLGGSRTKST